jgi:hypothetical protein
MSARSLDDHAVIAVDDGGRFDSAVSSGPIEVKLRLGALDDG